ncbi:F-box/LRR-repeat protein At3g59190 [Lactuca sativa]|uniref:F-box domain-containing protein n=1 Tax=Lactuca sativa TaxID=4236 RepID=A0A9R1WZE2_LACSA|nr:F-box/LRR-repeat protein At3g59190 [Lactuca sativa]KAJ0194830.1 hypothetical protein LSAT_V11C700385130 [Lactuca sativa]
MSEHRGHQQHEVEVRSDVVDVISNLPDCILDHILSFMPTKEVVKTSILSTRWKNLWASAPNIDFDDERLRGKEVDALRLLDVTSFVNFVERVLRLRDASNMEKFRLSCHVFRDAFKIRSWISHAIMQNVQELDLFLFAEDPSVIPQSMFNSTSLVSLKIRMDCVIEFPSDVSFPCLKTLHLSFVRFPNDDFTEKLFSGCRVLEELVLFRICLRNLKNIAISNSTLKRLTICDQSSFVVVNDPTSGCKIKIDAANLTYFEYIGFLSNKIILNNTSSLEKSFIEFLNPRGRGNELEVAGRAIDLLKRLKHVVSLRLSDYYIIETLSFVASVCSVVFPNLTHLMMTMEIENDTFTELMRLLSFCPVLQSICFSEGFKCFMHLGENHYIWYSKPICIENCLKTVSLKNFHGYKSEICFLKCVLKTACALERMDIRWSETYLRDLKRKTKARKELEKIERSSTAFVIKFS